MSVNGLRYKLYRSRHETISALNEASRAEWRRNDTIQEMERYKRAADKRLELANEVLAGKENLLKQVQTANDSVELWKVKVKESEELVKNAEERMTDAGVAKAEKEKKELENELRLTKEKAKEWEAKAEEAIREAVSWKRIAEPKKKTKQKKQWYVPIFAFSSSLAIQTFEE